jgi:tetratricopeptide (TPR) repeat protein
MNPVFICICCLVLMGCNDSATEQFSAYEEKAGESKALQAIAKSIQLYPDSTALIEQYIQLLDSAGDYTKAILQNERLLKNDSLNHALWYRKGIYSEYLYDTAAAIKYYRFSIKSYATPQALLALANLLAEQKNADALLLCKNTSTLFPVRELKADLYFIKGVYYARSGNYKEATSRFDSCIASRYRYLEAYMEKGFILYNKSQIDKAFLLFETTTKLNPAYADGYYWMAKCKQATNERTEAINYYQKALTFDSTIKEAKEAIQQLQ